MQHNLPFPTRKQYSHFRPNSEVQPNQKRRPEGRRNYI
jgi:hypothetical protein